ncbi:unnamed protein product [Camellia sinensis]
MLAKKGEKFINLPYVVKGMDVSFNGILSYLEATTEEKLKNNECTPANLCYSLQETVFPMLVEITKRAMAHCDKKDVLIVGDVGCNECLQEIIRIMYLQRGGKLFATDDRYCVDNGAMVAYTGLLDYANETSTPLEESTFTQRFRTDEVLAIWKEKKESSNDMELAEKGEKFIDLPYAIKGMDVLFNLCYSLEETVFPMLMEITEQVMAHCDKKDVLIVGGVGCNERLQEMMRIMCSERGRKLFATDDRYCVDNGAMIAYIDLLAYANETLTLLEESTYTQRYGALQEMIKSTSCGPSMGKILPMKFGEYLFPHTTSW